MLQCLMNRKVFCLVVLSKMTFDYNLVSGIVSYNVTALIEAIKQLIIGCLYSLAAHSGLCRSICMYAPANTCMYVCIYIRVCVAQ